MFSITFIPQNAFSQCVASKGTIQGMVFSDVNNNGIINAGESGINNVLVQAYGNNGDLLGDATTDASGSYSISALKDGSRLRIVFTYDSKYGSSFVGTNNASSVQFVQVPACSVSFGLVSDLDVCNAGTEILTTCFVHGPITENAGEPTIVGLDYGFNSTSPARKLGAHGETGSIWGLAWKNSTKEIFSSAFVKQFCGLKDGHDAIFRTVPNGAMFTTQLFTKLSTLGQDVGDLTIKDINNCDYGDQVGKMGLGAMVMSPDEKYLYIVNIYNNTLVKIPTVAPTAANTTSYKIPGTGNYAFALKYYNGNIYVGVTTPGVQGEVYAFNPTSGSFTNLGLSIGVGADWVKNPVVGGAPSHWLTDLDFTDTGDMIISLSDRIGHLYCNSLTSRLDEQKGDILMAWKTETGWKLEDKSGGKEFFSDDFWVFNPNYHPEITIGSVFAMPGTNSVVATVFDPEINAYSGGLHRYNTQTGKKEASRELYTRNTDINFGKATGFGEIIATCGLLDIEIGNLVWNDENGNGIQDAQENGFANVGLNIYDERCTLIGTTTTNANGNYLFNKSNVPAGLNRNTNYFIAIDKSVFDENSKSYVFDNVYYNMTKHVNGLPNIDSDYSSDVTDCLGSIMKVNVKQTQHSFDIGMIPLGSCSLKIYNSVVNSSALKKDDIVMFDIAVENKGGTAISSFKIENKIPQGYVFLPELNAGWVNNGGILSKTIQGLFKPGTKLSTVLSLKFNKNILNTDFTNTVKIAAITDIAGATVTDITGCLAIAEDGYSNALPEICDLALIHKVSAEGIFIADSKVSFVTTVCNQGTTVASDYEITNYMNKEFDFDPELNNGWVISPDLKFITFKEESQLLPKTCKDFVITYSILKDVSVPEIINFAEISTGSCEGSDANFDFDSTPDFNNSNDKGGQPNTATDNMLNDNGDIDEDDHDPAIVRLNLIDLSLTKTVSKRNVRNSEVVVFNLKVKNEGSIPVSKIQIVDYIPENMKLQDVDWNLNGSFAEKTLTIPGNLQPGQSVETQISLIVSSTVKAPATILNVAEIMTVYDQFGRNISDYDVDSRPDNINDNDMSADLKEFIEDDISKAFVVLPTAPVLDACSQCRPATTPTNGQFELLYTFASQSGEGWFVEQSLGLYDVNSSFPPAVPVLLLDSTYIVEQTHPSPGHSNYVFSALHLDGKGFSFQLRNKFGDLLQVKSDGGSCSFQKMTVSGPRSLCLGSLAQYKVNSNVNIDLFYWSVDNIPTSENSSTLNFDWTGQASGIHYVTVGANASCIAPVIFEVVIGAPDFSEIACVGDFNVSLDGDCSIVVTPAMLSASALNPNSPYVVMLTDSHGQAIPNATLTSIHAGTKVMAKLIEGCGGNSCWSFIHVEDKVAPVSICRDISLPCYKLDEYVGPFESDNCGGPVKNIIVSEKLTPLTCNEDYVKYIDRVYQATDKYGNKSALCTMRISLERPDFALLKFPHSLTLLNDSVLICNSYLKDELDRPSTKIAGVPTLAGLPLYPSFAPVCNLYAGYTDVEIGLIGCTKKVIRNWVVYEQWCSNGQTATFAQVIEITDTIAPVIKPLPDMLVTANGHHICEANVTLPLAMVTDSCNSPIEVDVTYPGGFIDNQNSHQVVTLPVGIHSITYTAYDACQNSSSISFTVKVEDKTAPTVICKGEIVVGLNSNGEAYLYPQNVDDGSFDGCGIDSMKLARAIAGTFPDSLFKDLAEFKCKDVLSSPHMVALRVWDSNGNSNSCMVMVTVQDKHRPKITCPADRTIDCSEVFTGMDLNLYGKATAIDACGATVTESTPKFVLNSCRVGYIERTFTASDGSGTATCKQTITVDNEDFFDPLTDIIKPLDFEVKDKCSVDDLKPENLPAINGFPILKQSACGMAAASYKDDVFTFDTVACFKILRTWTVIDWCEMQRIGSEKYEPYTFQQTIKVSNTVPPFFVGTIKDRDTIVTLPGNCLDALVKLKVTGRDLCTLDAKLRWSYKVDLFNNGTFDFDNAGFGNMASLSATMPVGLHKIQWSFEDACGNVVTKDQFIYVKNGDKPSASGLESISVSINPMDTNTDGIPDIEMACIPASSLNASSSSLCCTIPLKYSFSADINDTIRCFDCFDVGLLNNVQLWVHDCFGNTDFVDVNVEVQDNNTSNICEELCKQNAPTPAITGTKTICTTKSTTLTATGGVKYVWNTGATTTAITVSPIINTSYTVTVSNTLGCTASATALVTVNPSPIINITGGNICNGGSSALLASGGGTYLWNTGATTAGINVNPIINTTFTVTVTNTNGCSGTATKLVTVNPLPTVSVTGTNIVCRNSSTTLTASGGVSYIWSNSATTAAITVTPLATTTYTVTATDINGCSASASRTVTVNTLPAVAITGQNVICLGGSTSLTASGGTTYLWSTSATTAVISVTPTVTTTYTVTATDGNGCSGTANRTVTVNPLPSADITGNNVLCLNQSTTLTASGGVSYLWSTSATTTAITVTPLVTTTYSVTVTAANGCTNTAQRIVRINPLPTVSIAGTDVLCTGASTTLTASGNGASYVWSTGATTAAISVMPATTTTYTVTATGGGCTNTATRTVTVNSLPTAAITGDNTICLGESTTLTASGGGSYVWNTGATTAAITVTPTVNTTYTVTVTNANSCTASTSTTVMVDPGTLVCMTQNINAYLGPNGSVIITPPQISTGSQGSCANITAVVTPNQFFCNDIGPRIVTLTVTNTITGQSLSCTATVTVQDTIKPMLVCPANISINCDDYNPTDPLSTYGIATATDNCPNGLVITQLPIINLNQCNVGQITRTFTATDNSGNTKQCVQVISVVNNNPVTQLNITFPA
ncbi:MAG: DUF11 domain-containing protein [Saprospiraceae bacterium]|nr:DUF11 domain-containing protein [Saprospiraceae bacterium]